VHLRDLKWAVAAAHVLLALVEAFLVVLVEFLASIQPLEECGRMDIPDTYMASLSDVLLACWN